MVTTYGDVSCSITSRGLEIPPDQQRVPDRVDLRPELASDHGSPSLQRWLATQLCALTNGRGHPAVPAKQAPLAGLFLVAA
ncbi:MAG: hypothetical protein LC808_31060 [Actinobacteria bacterium]|nr:hypothetical protein [Actinomycetota bacterium]